MSVAYDSLIIKIIFGDGGSQINVLGDGLRTGAGRGGLAPIRDVVILPNKIYESQIYFSVKTISYRTFPVLSISSKKESPSFFK